MADAITESQAQGGSSAATSKRLIIKSMTISGFRSYSEAKVSNFSSRHNCIVGPNGSGKSNFFAALEFVLGEREFTSLTPVERHKLLHEGKQDETVLTAYVEVVFDNSEGRLPIDSDEVKLQRTVGLKKDEFFVNKKNTSKKDIENMLETAGFHKSNPYYICRQGKVAELCNMSDAQRLTLLKEVAGATVYDVRRKDSEKALDDARKKCAIIEESISNISNRLDELKQEKEELENFRELDRERKVYDYLLSNGQLKESEKKIEAFGRKREEVGSELREKNETVAQLSRDMEECESSLDFNDKELKRLGTDKKRLNESYLKLSKDRNERELDIKDQEERVKLRQKRLEESKQTLSKIEAQIAEAEELLDNPEGAAENKDGLKLQLARSSKELSECRESIKRMEQRESDIRSKQGRSARFGNDVKSRNQWLDEEIKKLQVAVESRNKTNELFEQQRRTAAKEKAECDAKSKKLEDDQHKAEDGRDRAKAARDKSKEQKREATDKTKTLRATVQKHESEFRIAEEDLKKAERSLSEIIPGAVDSGLRAIDEICRTRNIDAEKVHGPLFSLVRCEDPVYRTAVEIAAGNQLLHVVVDTDSTAAELMKGLLDKRAGRITFKPLNVLKQRERAMAQSRGGRGAKDDEDDDDEGPSGGDVEELMKRLATDAQVPAGDAIPLISKVTFDEVHAPAVRAMLGRTLLCRDQRVASLCSKKYKVDCVTLEGDQVSRRGALSGGFVDTKRSRLAAGEDVVKAKSRVQLHQDSLAKVKEQVVKEEQRVSLLAGELEKAESTLKSLEGTLKSLNEEVVALNKKRREIDHEISRLDADAGKFAKPTDLLEQIADLENEKKQPPLAALGEAERSELLAIPTKLNELRQREKDLSAHERDLSSRVNTLQSDLDENLRKQRDELLQTINLGGAGATAVSSSQDEAAGSSDAADSAAQGLEQAKSELEAIKREQEEVKTEMDAVEKKWDETSRKVSELKLTIETKKQELSKAEEDKAKAEEISARLFDSYNVHLKERDKAARKIRELGLLQPSEIDKHRNLSTKQLESKLQKVNTELKKFAGVNKKALDQFVTFSEQRQALMQRQKEVKEADAKIREMLEHLDKKKDEAIELTFKQISRNFREVFSELVPDGIAELRMVKGRAAEGDEDEAENITSGGDAGVNLFVGVSPRVSFLGSKDTVPMKQLSGGQKALVALTLIFAIQRCDPAPFYLFDEIDQALDANHRTAVAALIQRQARSSKGAQFITTTFRPELVEVADRCFGIQFSKKVSSVGQIDKDQALNFIRLASGDKNRKTIESESEEEEAEQEDEEEDIENESKKVTPKKQRVSTSPTKKEKASAKASAPSQGGKKRRASQRANVDSDDDAK